MRAAYVLHHLTDFRVLEVSHNSCNIGTRALPDMYALALGHHAYISGNALVPIVQLLDRCLRHRRGEPDRDSRCLL